jgi:hypothetical protein
MADSFQSRVWTELARELCARRDLRAEVRTALERALEDDDPEAAAPAIREALAEAVAGAERGQTRTARAAADEAERQRRELAQARHSQSLVQHALVRLASGGEVITPRLAAFLREEVEHYARARERLTDPKGLEEPRALAARVLAAAETHRVMARPLRVGILTPGEVAALASGALDPSAAGTVRSTGDLTADLKRWQTSRTVDEARKAAVAQGTFDDGAYLLAILEPTAEGHHVVAHPITMHGETTPEPIEEFSIRGGEEPIPVVQLLVEPAVREPQARQPEGVAPTVGEPRREPAPTADLPGLWAAAVALNQARLSLYARILEQRADLGDAARVEAERQLARMQRESEELASTAEPARLAGFFSKWSEELTRDMQRLQGASARGASDVDALSRMGALRHRVEGVRASIERSERRRRPLRGAGREERLLARPAVEPASIFDGLVAPTMARAARGAASKAVVGESLTADVLARDAVRSARPSRETRQLVKAIQEGGKQLQKALTTMHGVHDSGLSLSSELQPLLRAAMPSDLRPDLRSPLMRNVLLPALEQVSGRARTMARRVAPAQTAPALTADALYGMMLGKTGADLIQQRPDAAKNLMAQFTSFARSAEGSHVGSTGASFLRMGQELVARLTAQTRGDEVSEAAAAQAAAIQAAAELPHAMVPPVSRAAGVPAYQASRAHVIDDVAQALHAEGGTLQASLKETVAPFLPGDIPYAQRVFQGAMTDEILSMMGAAGATVGGDIYMRSGLSAQQKAEIAAHELTHVTQRKGASLESMEQQAYAVEAHMSSYFEGAELAAEDLATMAQDGQLDAAAAAAPGEDDLAEVIEGIAEIIQTWRREAAEQERIFLDGRL